MISFQDISKSAIDFFLNPPPGGWLLVVKIVFFVVSGLLLFGITYALTRSSYLFWGFMEDASEFLTFRPSGVRKITKTWEKIAARLETGLETEYKLAVIEADGLLDDVLRKMGIKGDTLEDRLKGLTSATLPNLDEIGFAHKSRTEILHNPDQPLSLDEARRLLKVYEDALETLQAF